MIFKEIIYPLLQDCMNVEFVQGVRRSKQEAQPPSKSPVLGL